MTDRVPPHDPAAETALACCLLAGSLSALELSDWTHPEEFFGLTPRVVFAAALELEQSGERNVDTVAIATRLRTTGKLDEAGGSRALTNILDSTPAIANPQQYARVVRSYYQRRKVIDVCRTVEAEANGPIDDQSQWLRTVETRMLQAVASHDSSVKVVQIGEALDELSASLAERSKGVSPATGVTGVSSIDAFLRGGLRPGSLYVVAGRPGMGKTALAVGFGVATARNNRGALIVELESPRQELTARIASMLAVVPFADIDSPTPTREAFTAIAAAKNLMAHKRLDIVDAPRLTPSAIRSVLRQTMAEWSRAGIAPGVLVVDYLGLMHSDEKDSMRERQVASNSAAMKELAKEFGIAVVLLSQINRQVEDRSVKVKIPQLSDLRESGAIEQDADVVMFCHRPAYYDKELVQPIEEANIVIAKHRNGKTGIVKAGFVGDRMQFVTIEKTTPELDDLNSSFDDPDPYHYGHP